MQKYKTILTAVDGSEDSDKAFDKAVETAKFNDAKLVLVHVIDTNSFALTTAYYTQLWERAEEAANELLDEYVQKAEDAGFSAIERVVIQGSPRSVITRKVVPEHKPDLIMVGATGKGAVGRFLMGSVSESITRHAECDVLVVK